MTRIDSFIMDVVCAWVVNHFPLLDLAPSFDCSHDVKLPPSLVVLLLLPLLFTLWSVVRFVVPGLLKHLFFHGLALILWQYVDFYAQYRDFRRQFA